MDSMTAPACTLKTEEKGRLGKHVEQARLFSAPKGLGCSVSLDDPLDST
jgi:hypothetical protein